MNTHDEHSHPEQQGLVISYHGSTVTVRGEDGELYLCHLRRNQSLPVVGDEVTWQHDSKETGVIMSIVPRRSILARGDGRGHMKPVAANLDVLVIVMAPPPVLSEYLIDRYLIGAELLSLSPIIVLNKVDLLSEADLKIVEARLSFYQGIPYPVVYTSVLSDDGLDTLKAALKDRCAALVGPSGVGKSSIIGALAQEEIQTGEVSQKGAGKHTTTATRLYTLPSGASLIDSPGVREFNLWPVSKEELLKGFPEFHAYTQGCKFRDCSHAVEPGCGVQAAVTDGKISDSRYSNFQTLMKKTTK